MTTTTAQKKGSRLKKLQNDFNYSFPEGSILKHESKTINRDGQSLAWHDISGIWSPLKETLLLLIV